VTDEKTERRWSRSQVVVGGKEKWEQRRKYAEKVRAQQNKQKSQIRKRREKKEFDTQTVE